MTTTEQTVTATAAETYTPSVGDVILLTYGNGTQVARIIAISARGALTVERGSPQRVDHVRGEPTVTVFAWAGTTSKLKADDCRVQGLLPPQDCRRHLPHFADPTAVVVGK